MVFVIFSCVCPTGIHGSSDRVQRLQETVHERMYSHSQPRHGRVPPREAQQQHRREEDQVRDLAGATKDVHALEQDNCVDVCVCVGWY